MATSSYVGSGVSMQTTIGFTNPIYLLPINNQGNSDELTQMIEEFELDIQPNTVTDIRNVLTGMNINHPKDIYKEWCESGLTINNFVNAMVNTITNTTALTGTQTNKLKKKIKKLLNGYAKKDETTNARGKGPNHTFIRYEPSANKTCSTMLKPYEPSFIVKRIGYSIDDINNNLNTNDHQVRNKRIIVDDISQTFKFWQIKNGDTITVTDK